MDIVDFDQDIRAWACIYPIRAPSVYIVSTSSDVRTPETHTLPDGVDFIVLNSDVAVCPEQPDSTSDAGAIPVASTFEKAVVDNHVVHVHAD